MFVSQELVITEYHLYFMTVILFDTSYSMLIVLLTVHLLCPELMNTCAVIVALCMY